MKAVIFDIDGVLLDSFEANLKFYQNLMTTAGYRPPTRKEFPALFHLSLMDVVKKLTGSQSEEEIMRVFKLGESREVDYPIELLNMPDGADETIKILSKDYPLGIVTSRIRNSIYEAPRLAALKKYFRVAVSYEDTDNHKPHPDPLLLAAKKLNVEPRECVYIGDVENDIKAARGAGMKSILYSKEKIEGADAETSDFKTIPTLVRNL
ncbi:MAG: HAD superfamily hydrolase [Parcubacteria group bacterium GW2011_GWA1_50_14]|uniref:HAD family hydrolase n=1 Tax=Candidatus Liptonbacteria bacterium GWB1_49_6 TaxID=1798644 RepID=A0A1G2C822_9BACT|nr:MAG: HAD superfamily hydrolase [Parcubacteria group bacterium GW2011_GWA1_50_14]OGY96647.1 MAG: hypothetical protein A2122_00425 [Candidatus Liptonbacteria bacterium GWB1_49_6]